MGVERMLHSFASRGDNRASLAIKLGLCDCLNLPLSVLANVKTAGAFPAPARMLPLCVRNPCLFVLRGRDKGSPHKYNFFNLSWLFFATVFSRKACSDLTYR